MTPTANPRVYRKGASQLITSAYTDEEIKMANERHDRINGFYFAFPNIYQNPFRLPESTTAAPGRAGEG